MLVQWHYGDRWWIYVQISKRIKTSPQDLSLDLIFPSIYLFLKDKVHIYADDTSIYLADLQFAFRQTAQCDLNSLNVNKTKVMLNLSLNPDYISSSPRFYWKNIILQIFVVFVWMNIFFKVHNNNLVCIF